MSELENSLSLEETLQSFLIRITNAKAQQKDSFLDLEQEANNAIVLLKILRGPRVTLTWDKEND